MAKTRRLLQDQIKRTDMIIEICDARLPYSSRNPELSKLAAHKSHLLLMNKADLADPQISSQWLQFFQKEGIDARLINAKNTAAKDIIGTIDRVTKKLTDKALERGIRKTVRAMIVGVPNVGKSTLINRLYGKTVTQTADRPGVTKSNRWVRISPYLEVLDTPGLLWPRLEDQISARRMCYLGTIKDDVIDMTELTIHLLEDLCDAVPEKVAERFHIKDTNLKGVELLDAVCAGRGWLLKGAEYDYDRCCSVVPDEFRAGKLGRISLEIPPARIY